MFNKQLSKKWLKNSCINCRMDKKSLAWFRTKIELLLHDTIEANHSNIQLLLVASSDLQLEPSKSFLRWLTKPKKMLRFHRKMLFIKKETNDAEAEDNNLWPCFLMFLLFIPVEMFFWSTHSGFLFFETPKESLNFFCAKTSWTSGSLVSRLNTRTWQIDWASGSKRRRF